VCAREFNSVAGMAEGFGGARGARVVPRGVTVDVCDESSALRLRSVEPLRLRSVELLRLCSVEPLRLCSANACSLSGVEGRHGLNPFSYVGRHPAGHWIRLGDGRWSVRRVAFPRRSVGTVLKLRFCWRQLDTVRDSLTPTLSRHRHRLRRASPGRGGAWKS
jgi:hypothetical protein